MTCPCPVPEPIAHIQCLMGHIWAGRRGLLCLAAPAQCPQPQHSQGARHSKHLRHHIEYSVWRRTFQT